MTYRSSKTYGHEEGLSACFRQWRATHSHCQYLHGYALRVHIEFEAETLDVRNWVVDFGSLKPIKQWLKDTFDHKTLVAKDDPDFKRFEDAETLGLIQMVEVEATGCEAFAEMIYNHVHRWLDAEGMGDRVKVHHVTVSEHGANSATFSGRSWYYYNYSGTFVDADFADTEERYMVLGKGGDA